MAVVSPISGTIPASTSGLGGAPGFFKLNPVASPFRTGAAPAAPQGNINVGGSAGSPGYTPDWNALIQGDSGLQAALAPLTASGIQDKSALGANVGESLAEFGDTNLNLDQLAQQTGLNKNDLASIVTPQVLDLAKQNTAAGTSTLARLAADNTKQVQAIKNALNARGLLNSGESGYELGQQQQNFTNSQFDARSSLLKAIQGYYQGYLQGQLQRAQSEAQAYSDAANREFSMNQGYAATPGTPGTAAHFLFTDDNGHPVYSDGQQYYDANGNPYSGPGYHPPLPGRVAYAPGFSSPASIFSFK